MRKLILSLLAAFFAAAGFAQGDLRTLLEPAEQRVELPASGPAFPVGELVIRRNVRYSIGGVPLSRRELLGDIAPAVPGLSEQIRKGVAMKRAAISFGVIGGTGICVGFFYTFISSLAVDHETGRSNRKGVYTGWGIVGGGALLGGISAGLAVGSVRAQKRAMKLYNETMHSGGAAMVPTLAFAPTRGGLGVQLTF